MARPLGATYLKVDQYLKDNQGKYFTAPEIGKALGIPTKTVSNALHSLQRNETISRGSLKGTWGYPGNVGVRNGFQVARDMGPAPKPERPAVQRVFSGKVHPELWAIIRGPVKDGRVTITSATSAVIWNSSEARRELGRFAWAI